MTGNARQLRRFRAWAKKRGLDLDRSTADRSEFLWSDTQLAWEAWQASAPVLDGYDNRVRISYD